MRLLRSRGAEGPPDKLDRLRDFDTLFLGGIGDAARVPDHVSLQLLLDIRRGFDQYVNLRPIRLYPGVDTVVRTATPESVDFVVVRENTEGEYAGVGAIHRAGTADAVALQTAVFTHKGCERVMRYAFDLARRRHAAGGGRAASVTNCTKSNALTHSMVFWDSVFAGVAAGYPDVGTRSALVDALTVWFLKAPEQFDVVVASNLFGDILTDLGAMLQGGLGFAAGGNINPERTHPSMFEPIHGTAPDIAGRGVANPVAAIESVRMMLEHLGEEEAAADVGAAVAEVLAARRVRTPDMGGTATTRDVGGAIAAALAGRRA